MKNTKEIKINIPYYPKLIIDMLKNNGYEAYIVGGCVRDELLGKKPDDYDITTNAKPEDIKRVFRKTVDTGIKHGTISVLFYDNNKPLIYEVTTFRVDGDYVDGRHPKDVKFVSSLDEDLYRRDFTINAMAYNDESGLVDLFNGIEDLDNKLIRAVGNPIERFNEDGLRLLRAIRFAAKLGFKIDIKTENAIRDVGYKLESVSKERVLAELTKTITSKNPEYVNKIFEYKLSKYICEGLSDIKIGNFESNLSVYLAFSCMFYYTNVDFASNVLKQLRLDNDNISKVKSLLEAKEIYGKIYSCKNDKIKYNIYIKELINFLGYDLSYDFIKLVEINGSKEQVKLVEDVKERVKLLQKEHCPIFIRDLSINGNDIMSIGYNGKEVGLVINWLLKIVHKNREYNNKETLMNIIKKIYIKYKGGRYEL